MLWGRADQPGWIFYFNTTPLIASRHHPIVERALLNATAPLEADSVNGLPEVQATTGPGNLTRSVFEVISEGCSSEMVMVAHDWELTSTSQWPLKALTGYGVLCNTSLNFKNKGFINTISDLSNYTLQHQLDGFVVDGHIYMLKTSVGYKRCQIPDKPGLRWTLAMDLHFHGS